MCKTRLKQETYSTKIAVAIQDLHIEKLFLYWIFERTIQKLQRHQQIKLCTAGIYLV